MAGDEYILRAAAPDAIGVLADVATLVARHRLSVTKSQDFADIETQRFFIWQTFQAPDDFDCAGFEAAMSELAARRAMAFDLREAALRPRALVMVSKADHCLIDLLYRARRGKLGAEIAAIVSNHETARWHAELHEIPFHHVPVAPETKAEAEARLLELVAQYSADLVVLARYMQVLSDATARALEGRCINIHHSALPSFKGARPYEQAHARGVKLIGATAHYVTADLDEGPIIAQDCEPVDHLYCARDLAEKGRDLEARVLSRAVTAHAEGRVFLNGMRTVVF
ncbi:MAG: formyltetrahydrofolate deformylase [Erythrobacter sp.]|jgi:formyltetrahydrofolate deformylase|nr:formyltetrahydrofolate deformylase [Erythrobacter sp.]